MGASGGVEKKKGGQRGKRRKRWFEQRKKN